MYPIKKTKTMDANWVILAFIFIGAMALILFLILRNQKDKNEFISTLNAQENITIVNNDKT